MFKKQAQETSVEHLTSKQVYNILLFLNILKKGIFWIEASRDIYRRNLYYKMFFLF